MTKIDLGRITPTYRGDYDSTVSYNELDIVYDDTIGKSFIAKQASRGKDLPVDKENEYWGIIAKQGPKGAAGEVGPKGEPGKDGIVPDFGNTSDLLPKNSNTVVGKLNSEFTDRGLNVKWFGAVGDGISDDTQAFKDTINKARENFINNSSNSNVIIVPNGNYIISDILIIPPYLKLKSTGNARLLINNLKSSIKIDYFEEDYDNEIISNYIKQGYTRGYILDGNSGGLSIIYYL